MSLRRRLVAGMLLLLIVAIVATDVVTSSYLRSFLIGRLDEQMDVEQLQAYTYIYETYQRARRDHEALATSNPQAWLAQLNTPRDASCVPSGPISRLGARTSGSSGRSAAGGTQSESASDPRLNASVLATRDDPDVYVEVLTASDTLAFSDPSGSCASPDPAPVLPKHLPVQAVPLSHVFGRNHGVYVPDRPAFTMASVGTSGPHYRAEAVAVPGGTLVTAIPLDPTKATLASLEHVEVTVSVIVVFALLILVLWIVRFGLRPLYDMTDTARAIAGGDLTRRIQRSDERSEVGRLGAALNGMLSQIEAAFKERESSESRLRRFVADASHELRTPLTSIRGYAELLRKGALTDDEARERASERIEHEAARMAVLVDDLLLLARLDQRRPIERNPVDLTAVVSDAVEAARIVQPRRAISLDLPDESVVVEGDAARLRQVVDNLLSNTQVHTPAGTPVHVAVTKRRASASISVADEGPGIDPEEQARVFDRFYRGSQARTGGGAGLGLSIVDAIARAHGGHARVQGMPGEGTTFVVEIPGMDQRTIQSSSSTDGHESGDTREPVGARSGPDAPAAR